MVRAAGLFIFIGAVGFLNFYDEILSSSDDGEEPMNQYASKRLQKKFGVKEKRSVRSRQAPPPRQDQPNRHLARHFERFNEELVDHYRMPLGDLASKPIDCRRASSTDATTCSCLRLLCFGGEVCTVGSLDRAPQSGSNSSAADRQLTRCRQTTIDAFLMCECKRYTPLTSE